MSFGIAPNGSRLGEVAEHKTSIELQMFKLKTKTMKIENGTPTNTKREHITAAQKWGFSFHRGIVSILCPNGMGRKSPLSPARVSRIPFLTETMIEQTVNQVIAQHNHYIQLMLARIDGKIKSLEEEEISLNAAYKVSHFYNYKKRKQIVERLKEIYTEIPTLRSVLIFMEMVSPENVKEAVEDVELQKEIMNDGDGEIS